MSVTEFWDILANFVPKASTSLFTQPSHGLVDCLCTRLSVRGQCLEQVGSGECRLILIVAKANSL